MSNRAISQIVKGNSDLPTTASDNTTPQKQSPYRNDTKELVKHFENKLQTFSNRRPARLSPQESSGFTSGFTSSETGYNPKKSSQRTRETNSKSSKLETIYEHRRDRTVNHSKRNRFDEDEVSHSRIVAEQRSRNNEQMSYTDTESDEVSVPIKRVKKLAVSVKSNLSRKSDVSMNKSCISDFSGNLNRSRMSQLGP
jgi:hypothetical protein